MTDISQLILLDENNNLHLYDLVKEKILNVFETLEFLKQKEHLKK